MDTHQKPVDASGLFSPFMNRSHVLEKLEVNE
jgi:hypothetical protein